MNKILKFNLGLLFFSFSSALLAEDYQVNGVFKLETIEMKHELAKKVVPVVRTFISTHGHIAHLEGSDHLIVKATPNSIQKLREILANITLENFNKKNLAEQVSGSLQRKEDSLETRVIPLKNLKAEKVVPALRALVSQSKMSIVEGKNHIKITDSPDFLDEMTRLISNLDGV